jgi:hypothetical protein
VFHIDDQQWISMYNDQGLESACRRLFALYLYYASPVLFEALKFKAWTEGGPDLVIEEAQKRLREQGWNAVRPALSTTIRLVFSQIYQYVSADHHILSRAWIMRGWVEGGLKGTKPVTVEWLSRALEVLDWGKTAWKNVSRTDRGVIFDSTFIRAVRSLHLNAFMEVGIRESFEIESRLTAFLRQAYAQNPGPDSKFPLVDLLEEADDILCEQHVDTPSPDGEYDPGFISSFYCYPYSQALSCVQIRLFRGIY